MKIRMASMVMAAAIAALGLFPLGQEAAAQVKKKPVLTKRPAVKAPPVSAVRNYTVPAGKKFRVRMNESLSSKTAGIGDTFTVTVTEPVYSSTGVVVIPVGSEVLGRVDSVKPAKKGGHVGEIEMSFTQIVLPNGMTRTIIGSLTELISDDAKSDNEGTASGDKTKHRKVKFIGGGGAGGAILGGVVGGGKGALIGGIIGGVGGLIAETQTKGEEAVIKPGTEFGVYLNRSISLPRYAEAESVQ